MSARPELVRGRNRLWIRFFLLAVYATMYVRDHTRPELYKAFGMDITAYDYEVFRITSACASQIFPFSVDIDNPKFRACMERLRVLGIANEEARETGGFGSALRRIGYGIAAAATFARLYTLPVVRHAPPAQVRMAPAW